MLTLEPGQLRAQLDTPESFAGWYVSEVMEPRLGRFGVPRAERTAMTLAALRLAEAGGLTDARAKAVFVHFCWTLGPGFHRLIEVPDVATGVPPGLDRRASAALAAATPEGWLDPAKAAPSLSPIPDSALEDRARDSAAALAKETFRRCGAETSVADLTFDLAEVGRTVALGRPLPDEVREFLPNPEALAEDDFAALRARARAHLVAISAVLAARRRAAGTDLDQQLTADLGFIDRALDNVGVTTTPEVELPPVDPWPDKSAGRWVDASGAEVQPGTGAWLPDPKAQPALHEVLSRLGAAETGLPFRDGHPDFTAFSVRDRQGNEVRATVAMTGTVADLAAARGEAARLFGSWKKTNERGRVWIRDGDSMVLVDGDLVTAWRRCDGGRL